MSPEPMVPVARFRPLVERWVAEFDTAQIAYELLAASSPYTADAWRSRLSAGTKRSRGNVSRGWFCFEELDAADVDEFLAAAELTHLWRTELAEFLPAPSLEEFDATCGECGAWIDWTQKDAGARVVSQTPREASRGWYRYWSLCFECGLGLPEPIRSASIPANGGKPSSMDAATARRLHLIYERGELSAYQIAQQAYARLGYPDWQRCRNAMEYQWRKLGLGMRSTREAEYLSRRYGRACTAIVDKRDGRRPYPCVRHALADGEFCYQHDPRNRAKIMRDVRNAQAKIRRPPTIEWEQLRPHLEPLMVPRPDRLGRHFEKAGGALARNTGSDPAICARLVLGRQPRVTYKTANRLLAPLGLTVADVLARELEEAA